MYFRKKSIVSTWDSSGRRSLGAVVSSSTMTRARARKTSLPNSARSTSRRQISRSVKSKGPSCGHVTTFRIIARCTLLGLHMARSCQAVSTSRMRSLACGSLRQMSIFVSCASLSARKSRWQCSMRAGRLAGRCSTSFRTSLSVRCTPRQETTRSRPSFTTASTTPRHSPKRSGSSPCHFFSSSSRSLRSPSSMATCRGGRSRIACLIASVIWRSVCSWASVCLRASARRLSMASFSSSTLRSHSIRNSDILFIMSCFSCSMPCSHSSRKSASCFVISAFSSAICSHSARDSTVTFAMAAFSSASRCSNSARSLDMSRSIATWSSFFIRSSITLSSHHSCSSRSVSCFLSSSWP
mmetsp:Transcript_99771/g.282576  ORF Transcript_99771/g.282576 Transcript_99771/m.282576 type:complete len:354 (+) Transcript_99771:2982-4043(+)